MAFRLGPRASAAGHRLLDFDTIGSTNAAALAEADAGETGPLWCVTADQTGGRGRRGRPWQGTPGNLAASILVTVETPAAVAATIGFVAGLALADALDAVAGERAMTGLALKWPNDVLLDGAKLAGILLEARARPGETVVVAGMGVNVLAGAVGTPYPATHLGSVAPNVTAEDLFRALSDAWASTFAAWEAGGGFEALRERWLARAAGVGSDIAVTVGGRTLSGVFETVDSDGYLVLRMADGSREAVAAGEVHFGAAATARPD